MRRRSTDRRRRSTQEEISGHQTEIHGKKSEPRSSDSVPETVREHDEPTVDFERNKNRCTNSWIVYLFIFFSTLSCREHRNKLFEKRFGTPTRFNHRRLSVKIYQRNTIRKSDFLLKYNGIISLIIIVQNYRYESEILVVFDDSLSESSLKNDYLLLLPNLKPIRTIVRGLTRPK